MARVPRETERSKRVGIWIRVSTEEQAQGDSPELHERRAKAYAEARGWEVRAVYRLEAVSGRAVMAHPEAKRMLADVSKGAISGLIFSKLARLARNTKELLEFADYFRQHEADLVSLGESIDTSTPAGRLFYTMIAAMAEWEREEIVARIQASIPVRAKLGKPLSGSSPFGYAWKNGVFSIEPNEAPIRMLMYELFLEHQRLRTVARLLNERGLRSRKNKLWSKNAVARLLRDPSAKGIRRSNYTKNRTPGQRASFKPENEWVEHPVEAIVPVELWEACNAILTEQQQGRKPRTRQPRHVFAGFTYCSCGEKMYVLSNSPKYVCRKCRNKIPIVDLDGVFHAQLEHFVLSPEALKEHFEKGDAVLAERRDLVRALEGERAKVAREIDKLHVLYQRDVIDPEGFGERYRPLRERLRQIDEELPEKQAALDVLRISNVSQEEVLAQARYLHLTWPTLPQEAKRSVIETIVEKITIGQGDIDISLLYVPSPNAERNDGNLGTMP